MSNSIEGRIFGPPGTGKTTTMVSLAEAAVEKYGSEMVSICSLTNAAVKEAVGRDLPVAPENVTTLHARCKRSLAAKEPAEDNVGEFAEAVGFGSWLVGADALPRDLRRKIELYRTESTSGFTENSPRGETFYERAHYNRQMRIPKKLWNRQVLDWFREWSRWCHKTGRLDFTGWLEACLEKPQVLPQQMVVYVDEAQDHTPLQLEVLRRWPSRYLVMIGDDDQCLYEWAGARPDRFLTISENLRKETVLDQSYRVPQTVHTQSTRMSHRILERREKVYRPTDRPGAVETSNYHWQVPLQWGKLPPGMLEGEGNYMILASCDYMLDPVIELMQDKGIAYHNPYRKSNQKWNPLDTPGARLRCFLGEGEKMWTGREAHRWASALGAGSGAFLPGQKEAFLEKCKRAGDRPINRAMLEAAFAPEILARIGRSDVTLFPEYSDPKMSDAWQFLMHVLRAGGDWQRPRVIIGTIHSVKGGEADTVYLMPDMSRAGGLEFQRYPDRMHRLFYVGMTRAKSNLVLCQKADDSRHYMTWPFANGGV